MEASDVVMVPVDRALYQFLADLGTMWSPNLPPEAVIEKAARALRGDEGVYNLAYMAAQARRTLTSEVMFKDPANGADVQVRLEEADYLAGRR